MIRDWVPGALARGVFFYLLLRALVRLMAAGVDRASRYVDRKFEASSKK